MRGRLLIAPLLLLPLAADAGGGRLWKVDSAKELASGEGAGIRFEAEGGISPGPALSDLGKVEEMLVLSAVRSKSGDLYVGTGFAGNVHRISGKTVTKLETEPGTAVFALAASGDDVFAATTPGGKVFRLGAKPELVAESGLASVFAMAAESSGSLLVAGGSPGKLVRLRKSAGKWTPETLIDSKESNLRSLAIAADGTIWCGSDGHGLLYRIAPGKSPEVLADAARSEVVALLPRPDGGVLFASTSGETVTNRPVPAASTSAEKTPSGSVTVSVETNLPTPATGSGGRVGFDLQLLRADGLVESLASREDELAYALASGESGKVLLATGPKGRIYELDGRNLSILREIPEKSAVALVPLSGGAVAVAGAEGGTLHRIGPGRDPKAVFTSAVHAEERRSRWGAFRLAAAPGTKGKLEFRSGNSPAPDETWSAFAEAKLPEGEIPSPAGRYLQWRWSFAGEGFVRSVVSYAVPGNLPPSVDSVTVLDPGVVFFRGAFGSGTPILEAANPEEHGMFTTVGDSRERPDLGKRMFRHGYRTVAWKASDPNDDPLLFDLRVRRVDEAGRPLGEWLLAASDLTESVWSFDSSVLPDGLWQFEVKVSDRKGNAGSDVLGDAKVSLPVVFDDTAPEVRIRASSAGGRVEVNATVVDALSPILRAEYSVDGGDWVALRSVDGVVDERSEEFSISAARPDGRPVSTVVLRVLDTSFNIATKTAFPEETR